MYTGNKGNCSREADRRPVRRSSEYGQAKKVVKRAAESERQRVVTKQQRASLEKVDEEVALGQKAEMARVKATDLEQSVVGQLVAECRPSHPFALAETRRCSTQQSRGAVDAVLARRATDNLERRNVHKRLRKEGAKAPRPKRACRRPADVVNAPAVQHNQKRSREGGGRRAESIYCFGCKKHISGGCRKHKMTFVPDRPGGDADYARLSCPGMLSVSPSLVAGRGVWADRIIPAGHCFGPFKGVVIKRERDSSEDYTWSVGRGRGRRFIDSKSEREGNWMRFVNHADEGERNLCAFEMDGQIWYVATEDIRRGVELKTDYGPGFASRLPKKPPPPVYDLSKVFACKKCKDGFSSAALLDAHVARRHPAEPKAARKQAAASSSEKIHRCSSCAYATDNICKLRLHERVHSGERPYVCAQCSAAFTVAHHLKDHSRTHTGERPYACTDCGKTFGVKANLNSHRRIHEGVKAFKCDYCSKRFTQLVHLTTHLRVHTGEKPFVCSFCGRAFLQSAALTRHVLVHTGEKPYVCGTCRKAFSRSDTCKRHEKVMHHRNSA